MGVLKIECYSNDIQMDCMIKMVSDAIYSQSMDCLSDIDQPIEDMRVCVDFRKTMSRLEIKSVEVLDANWDVLYEDSAVLASRLKLVVGEYNCRGDEGWKQAVEIINDQRYSVV